MAATTPSSYTMLREPDPRVEFYHTETPVPGTKTTFAVWAPKARANRIPVTLLAFAVAPNAASHRASPSPPLRRRQRTRRASCPCSRRCAPGALRAHVEGPSPEFFLVVPAALEGLGR